jgi:hypothetical protein
MGEAEVVGFEGVGRGVMGLLRLWKGVERCGKVRRLQGGAIAIG